MSFAPLRSKQTLLELTIPLSRDISLADAAAANCVGRRGSAILRTAIECLMVGMFGESRELMSKSHQFLLMAIGRNERDPGMGIALDDFALSYWFLTGSESREKLVASVGWKEKWYEQKGNLNRLEVQLSLLPYLEAGLFEALIARYESVGLTKPKSLSRIKGQGTMCYVLARHRLGLDYTDEQIGQALQTFFKRSMQDWLRGHYTTVARWMKVANWKPGDDPIATVLRCYDYLPDLEPPVYLPA